MLSVLPAIALAAVISLLLGLPIGLLTRRATGGWGSLFADGLVFGFLLLTLAPTLFAWFGVAGIVLFALAWLGSVAYAIVRRSPWPERQAVDVRGRWFVAASVLVGIVAVLLRLHSSNFLPWLGDMGAYVNWANEFARTGVLSASWPPLMSSYLALWSWLLGPAMATSALALAGLLLIVAVSRLLGMLRVNRWLVLLVAGVITVHVHAIWYSYFPSSEALNAPLYVTWLVTIVGAITSRRSTPWVLLNGAVMLALGLLRGTGPFLLLPLGVLAVLSLLIREWKPLSRSLWWILTASVVGSAGAFWYGITRIPEYYVDTQFRSLVPAKLADFVQFRLGVFTPSVLTAAVILIGILIVAFVAYRLKPGEAALPVARTPWPVVLGAGLVIILVLGLSRAALHNDGGWQILERMGLLIVVLAIFALLLGFSRHFPPFAGAIVLLVGAVATMFIGLQIYRLKDHSTHAFFLYWDRYFVSEVLPSLFVLLGITLQGVFLVLAARPAIRDRVRPAMLSVPALLVASVLVLGAVAGSQAHNLKLLVSDTYMRGAYDFQSALDSNIPNRTIPVLWTATSARTLPGFFFPNTWMAFGRPMFYSFGYHALRVRGRDNFGPDQVADARLLGQTLACTRAPRIIVFEMHNGGPSLATRLTDPDFAIRKLDTERGTISLLSQPPVRGGWQYLKVAADAYSVSLAPGAPRPTCAGGSSRPR